MPKECIKCKREKNYINEEGICIICEWGYGGLTKEVQTGKNIPLW